MTSDPINAALPPELYDWKDGLPNLFNYAPRKSHEVRIGNCPLGGDHPLRIQSMTTTPTADAAASAAQCRTIIEAGADYVRLTAQGTREAEALREIKEALRREGISTPLVADIHFNPNVADVAAEIVEKVRINPGNYVDPARKFKHIEYTDEAYAEELRRLEERFVKLLGICRAHGTALRIGVNHGSLSDRIMSRYGDTPAGMTESAMEFLRVCRDNDFSQVVISIKASNVVVMTETVRRLVAAMEKENMHFPLHLGVTEAGDGEDGRVKSAVGIGSLLADGIGDTIRVSLSEPPEAEIPVARQIVDIIDKISKMPVAEGEISPDYDPVAPTRIIPSDYWSVTKAVGVDFSPAAIPSEAIIIDADNLNSARAQFHTLRARQSLAPTIAKLTFTSGHDYEIIALEASVKLGTLLLAGFADGIWIEAPHIDNERINNLQLAILQATRRRFSKTEYIACPSCGRTLFDLPTVLDRVRKATSHLPGLKIAVMGCIVNGPGEMADADYGYIGAAAGNVSLYKGKECKIKNVPADRALPLLIDLIKAGGDWTDPLRKETTPQT